MSHFRQEHDRHPTSMQQHVGSLCSSKDQNWMVPENIARLAQQYHTTPVDCIVEVTRVAITSFNLQGVAEPVDTERCFSLQDITFFADWLVETLQHFQANGHKDISEAFVSCAKIFLQHSYFKQHKDCRVPEQHLSFEDGMVEGLSTLLQGLQQSRNTAANHYTSDSVEKFFYELAQYSDRAADIKQRAIRSLGHIKSPSAERMLLHLLESSIDAIDSIENKSGELSECTEKNLSAYQLCFAISKALRDQATAGPLAVISHDSFEKIIQRTDSFQSVEWKNICAPSLQKSLQSLFGDAHLSEQIVADASCEQLLDVLCKQPSKEILAQVTATAEGRIMLRKKLKAGLLDSSAILPIFAQLYVDPEITSEQRKAVRRLMHLLYQRVDGPLLLEHIAHRNPKIAHLAQRTMLSQVESTKQSWSEKKAWLSSIFPLFHDPLERLHTTNQLRSMLFALFGNSHRSNKVFPSELAHAVMKLYVADEASSDEREQLGSLVTFFGDPTVIPLIQDAITKTTDPQLRLTFLATAAKLGCRASAMQFIRDVDTDTDTAYGLHHMLEGLYGLSSETTQPCYIFPHTIFHPRILAEISSPTAYASLLSVFEISRAYLEFAAEHHGFLNRVIASLLNPPDETPVDIARQGIAYAEALRSCEELRIKAPFRFSAETLIQIVAERKNLSEEVVASDKIALLYTANRYADHNGALYDLEPVTKDLIEHGYRVLYFEAHSTNAMKELVAIKKRYRLEPDVLLLAAHGTRHGLRLIRSKYNSNRVGVVALRTTPGLHNFVKPDGAVVLCSCEAAYGAEDSAFIHAVESTLAAQSIVIANSRIGPVPSKLTYDEHNAVTGALSNGQQVFYVTDRSKPQRPPSAEERLLNAIFGR